MADMNNNKIYTVDFNGTLSIAAEWPEIGQPNETLFKFLLEQQAEGARMILYTCRSGEPLAEAVRFCKYHGLEFDAVNENLPELIEEYGGDTRKIEADYYIDDKAVNPIKNATAEILFFGKYAQKIKKGM